MSVYKIYCKNPDITDCYLGSSKNVINKIKKQVFKLYNFIREHLNEDIKVLSQFTRDHIINAGEDGKKKYLCSDQSRTIFKYKEVNTEDENGVIQKDVKATKLKKAI